ncbi:EFR1 family ferrodoxin [Candidatus Xianfuyuplasma coldseepsis]|uniref:4Fe-4S ferredoxin-type domain-containing protein n=1 Tax=Candidatus Xianfuyuplasma coldseepsis TaxID=2782163 RepID=A0A7L7KPX5_9MOLU|nr:EFR1 family ferrodoxin [Xianfuyuplasma coldseepsis]QMS84236.1 hypothetical protein G4Z02_00255 [Xianfuyuplasma coldseepsis]
MDDLYIYFSGTGNTKYVMEQFAAELSSSYAIHSIEEKNLDFTTLIHKADTITIGYPIYESMMPHIMEDFLVEHQNAFELKTISVIVTQMLFSGDGANLACKLLKHQDIKVEHTIHINMPNNLTDLRIFPVKTHSEASAKIEKAHNKIIAIVDQIKRGKNIKSGRMWYSWILGFFVQRLYARMMDKAMRKRLYINHKECSKCRICVGLCPVDNLEFKDNRIITMNQCTLCYRCINSCPEQAISLFTKKGPKKQYIRPDYR